MNNLSEESQQPRLQEKTTTYQAIGMCCADVQRASGLEHYKQHGIYVLTEKECIASRTAMGVLRYAWGFESPHSDELSKPIFQLKPCGV